MSLLQGPAEHTYQPPSGRLLPGPGMQAADWTAAAQQRAAGVADAQCAQTVRRPQCAHRWEVAAPVINRQGGFSGPVPAASWGQVGFTWLFSSLAWSCLDESGAGACTMLSAVKMEGHEHPDWSSSYYYAEPEVREFHPWVLSVSGDVGLLVKYRSEAEVSQRRQIKPDHGPENLSDGKTITEGHLQDLSWNLRGSAVPSLHNLPQTFTHSLNVSYKSITSY